jgi:subtilase family serine protease
VISDSGSAPCTGITAAAKIGGLSVSGPTNLRKGKPVTLKVKIKNTGNAQAKGVRLVVSGRGIRFNAPVGTINAGVTRTVNVRVRPTRTGRINAGFRADSSNAGSRSISKRFVVR